MAKFVIKNAVQNGRQYYWWVFVPSANNEIVCTSETYWSKDNALHSIELVKQLAPGAQVYEQ